MSIQAGFLDYAKSPGVQEHISCRSCDRAGPTNFLKINGETSGWCDECFTKLSEATTAHVYEIEHRQYRDSLVKQLEARGLYLNGKAPAPKKAS